MRVSCLTGTSSTSDGVELMEYNLDEGSPLSLLQFHHLEQAYYPTKLILICTDPCGFIHHGGNTYGREYQDIVSTMIRPFRYSCGIISDFGHSCERCRRRKVRVSRASLIL